LSALTGKQPASEGSVLYAGRDLYENYGELRNRVGFVPQSDLLHLKLRTREALEFAAALRFPKDTPAHERQERIEETLEILGLTERAELPIEKLSGGQRKRTSVALELLTEPSLLFLDEPTSGLDPGLDRQVMNLLRDLANDGRTVLVVTHSVANLDVCDEVIVMAPGGRLAYQGSPHGVFNFFGAKDWSEVFDVLHSSDPVTWSRRASQRDLGEVSKETPDLPNIRQQPWFYQLAILCLRYLKVIGADKAYVLILVALPFIMAAVGSATGNDYGLGEGPSSDLFFNPQARSLLLIFILGASFMGLAASVQELVKERAIFARERSIGLSPDAYFASKVLVLGVIVAVQVSIFVLISLVGRDMPESGIVWSSARFEIVVVAVMLGVGSMLLGLLISALVRSTDVTMPALVLVTMAQVVMSGVVPLRNSGLIDVIGLANPGYWAMNALGATVALNDLAGLTGDDKGTFWEPVRENFTVSALALVVLIVIIGAFARIALSARNRF
jgi:ABC-type multidrug transport system ATPase subunit